MRIKIIRFVIIGLFCGLVADLFYVQALKGNYYFRLSENNMIRVVPLEGWRGKIIDRNGTVLADNRRAYNVMVMGQEIKNSEEIFDFLSKVLKVSSKKLKKRYFQRKTAPFIPVIIAKNISSEKAIIIEENKYRFPGIFVEEGYKRFYPFGENSAHVLGHVNKVNRAKIKKFKEYGYSPDSMTGYSGVEEYYDAYLRGEDGGLQIEVNSRGKQVRLLSLKDPSKGQDIVLTVDKDIQQAAMDVLQGKTGSIIVMDTSNGEVLAMTNAPSFNPNYFLEQKFQKQMTRLFSDSRAPLLNRSISGQYPPGSVFKIPVALGGFDSREINRRTTHVCKGKYQLGNMNFGCTHVHGSQNLIESIAHSCNVYYYKLGQAMGAEKIGYYARMLGLGDLTNIDLPFEKKGRIPNRKQGLLSKKRRWYTGDTLNMSIGQGDVLTTPIQLVYMMSTILRDGVMVQPHLIYSIGGYRVNQFDAVQKLKINQEALDEVKKGMRATVTDYAGTAHVLNLREVYVAGKTGTAQTGKDKEHHAWFVGYAKGEKKDIAFCVFLEHGGSSLNACLLAKEFLLKLTKARKI